MKWVSLQHKLLITVSFLLYRLAEMILDKKLLGTLDQGSGILVLFEEPRIPSTYSDGIEVFNNLAQVVESLHKKAQRAL